MCTCLECCPLMYTWYLGPPSTAVIVPFCHLLCTPSHKPLTSTESPHRTHASLALVALVWVAPVPLLSGRHLVRLVTIEFMVLELRLDQTGSY